MIPISVCMIVKNEEKNIEKCLQKLAPYPYEIIVVDTGSCDRTKELARKYTEHVYDFVWIDDFSAARNFSIEKANSDWILVIDCDEFIEELDHAQIQELISKYPESIGQLTRKNICYDSNRNILHTTDLVERLFHRKYYHYEGRIHEQVVRKDHSIPSAFEIPLFILHTGYTGTQEDLTEKAERNIRLLLLDLQDNPDDPYTYFQLGESYMLQNDYENAYIYFDKGLFFDVDESLEYVKRMVVSYGYCLLHTNRIEQAASLSGIYDAFCNNADYLFLMGNIYLKLMRNEEALALFLKATQTEEHFDEGTNSYRAFHNIGCIYEAYGLYREAITYYQKAGDYPMSTERLQRLQEKKEVSP